MLARFGILPALRQQGRLDWHGPPLAAVFVVALRRRRPFSSSAGRS